MMHESCNLYWSKSLRNENKIDHYCSCNIKQVKNGNLKVIHNVNESTYHGDTVGHMVVVLYTVVETL